MKIFSIVSILSLLMGLFSCQASSKGFESVSVEDFENVIADSAVIRLDVRTAEEFAEGHIENSLNIDVLQSDFEQKALAALPVDKTIAVNCRSGRRSKDAARVLVKHGYKVVELDAGYNGWIRAGKKTVR